MKPSENAQDWINRLNRIENQIRELQSMVESNQTYFELMMQISSVKADLHQLSVNIFETRLQEEFQIISLDNPSLLDDHFEEILFILSHNFK